VTRLWPVNGTYSPEHLELYNFIVAYRTALLNRCKPGVTVREVLDGAAAEMREYADTHEFSKPAYRESVENALRSSAHMQHPVGLAVHDVGDYKSRPLEEGVVFSVDAMMWVPSEGLYIRNEDVVVITADGVENFTDFIPVDPAEIEAIMREPGILDTRPPVPESEIR
jgi:Xaa-Pro aminopeptidase